ncbi:unnamed protein product [Moneuplotes crassus]|uniref:Uncharacterized protein n=1 Tax=Euplotes crassus TaxID=5936 RepID=A0AAD2D0F8_EUPCR|nr:unnamed protein product [Moneuplotes crassus]
MDDVNCQNGDNQPKKSRNLMAYLSLFFTKLFREKAEQCQHKDDCPKNAVKGFIKNFVIAYCIKIGGQVLMMSVKRKYDVNKILQNMVSKDCLSFAMFLASVAALYKSSLCLTRRFNRTHDKYNAAIAGAISSFACLADKNVSRRQAIVFYLSSRVLESFFKLMDNHHVMAEPKEWGFYVMAVGAGLFGYQVWCERDTALKSALKTMDKFAALKKNDIGYMQILHKVSY